MHKKRNKSKKITKELKSIPYELFIGSLSVLSIFNIAIHTFVKDIGVLGILIVINIILSVIFLVDFFYRIITARSRKEYFIHQFGWADLLASIPIPQLKALRLFRLFRVYRLLQALGVKRVFYEFIKTRGGSALLTIFLIAFLVFEFGGIFVLIAERNATDANILTSSDALWWIMATVTTVGYGDTYPVTNAGRIVGVLVMITGIGLFGTLTGFLANLFLSPKEK